MTLKRKQYLILLLVCIFALSLLSSSLAMDQDFEEAEEEETLALSDFVAYESNNLELHTWKEGDMQGNFLIKNKKDGSLWYSNPPNASDDTISLQITRLKSLLVIRYHDPDTDTLQEANSYMNSVLENGMELFMLRKGLRFDFNFPKLKIKIPVNVTVSDDDILSIKVQTDKITEKGNYKLFGLTLAPYLSSASNKSKGFIFLPDGSGALMKLNNGKTRNAPYEQSVYGGDFGEIPELISTRINRIAMPVYGIIRDGSGLFTVIEEGAAQSRIYSTVADVESNWNFTNHEFELRQESKYTFDEGWQGTKTFRIYQQSPIQIPILENKYYFLSGDEADIKGMADTYRSHLNLKSIEETGGGDLKPKVTLSLVGAVRKKISILGFPGYKNIAVTEYAKAVEMVDALILSGVENISVRYLEWEKNQVKGAMPNSSTPHAILGGKKAFKEMIESFSSSGVEVFPNYKPYHLSKNAFPFQQYLTAGRNLNGQINKYYPYKINLYNKNLRLPYYYLLNDKTLLKNWEKLLNSFKKSPSKNISLTGMGEFLSSDYSNSKNPVQVQEAYERDQKLIKEAGKNSENLMLNFPNLPAGLAANRILDIPDSSNFDMHDYSMPFYQMILAGNSSYTGPAINLFDGGNRLAFLVTAASGSDLHYALTPENTGDKLDKTEYADWLSSNFYRLSSMILDQQKELAEIYESLGSRTPVNRTLLENGVWKCDFYSGNTLWINFNKDSVFVNGIMLDSMAYYVEEQGGGK